MKSLYLLPIAFFGSQFHAMAAITISEIDLTNNTVEIVNTGTSSQDISNWWWCNRVNGSPFYDQVNDVSSVDASRSTVGATTSNFLAGATIVLSFSDIDFLPDDLGELGLYTTNSFGSSNAIVDYVSWNSTGIRDNVANAAGLWETNETISFTSLEAGETLQALAGTDGLGPTQWSIGSSTLGLTNIPEPSTTVLISLFSGILLTTRRRK